MPHEADQFGAKLVAVVFIGAEKVCHLVKKKKLSWV